MNAIESLIFLLGAAALLAQEREAIVSLRDRGEITPQMMRRIMRDIDLEESRIGG